MSTDTEAGVVVVDATDWSIIPAENLVAAAQAGSSSNGLKLLMVASNAKDALTLFGALEKGVDGVVMATDDVSQVLLEGHCMHVLLRRPTCCMFCHSAESPYATLAATELVSLCTILNQHRICNFSTERKASGPMLLPQSA